MLKKIIENEGGLEKAQKLFNSKSIIDGFTTNPSLMRLAGAKNYKDYSLKNSKGVVKKKPISFEVFYIKSNLKKEK